MAPITNVPPDKDGNKVFTLEDAYSRAKVRPKHTYRNMTLEEAKALKPGETAHVRFLTDYNEARRVKVKGVPQTWKRTPSRVRVPVKYGMYLNLQMESQADGGIGSVMGTRLVVRIDGGED